MVLIRVDDRLIHGQVVVGWAGRISTDIILLADDTVAGSPEESELYLIGVPPDIRGEVMGLKNAAELLNSCSGSAVITVVRSLKDAAGLYDSGYRFSELNIGGMHSKEGKTEINHFVYMDREDMKYMKYLMEMSVEIYIQDLPTNQRYGADYILKKWEKNEKFG